MRRRITFLFENFNIISLSEDSASYDVCGAAHEDTPRVLSSKDHFAKLPYHGSLLKVFLFFF